MARRPRKALIVADKGLSPAQITAAALIGTGHTVNEAATACEVDRRTVYRWMLDPKFQAESAAYVEDVTRAAKDRMRALALKAVERAGEALDAVKPVYLKETDGKGNTAYVPGEDIPDHNSRLRASADILDRAGMPRRVETEQVDSHKKDLEEIERRLREKP